MKPMVHDMKNKKYSIVYSSLTGNTKVLADAIHGALPQDECEYFGVSDTPETMGGLSGVPKGTSSQTI